MVSDPVDFNLAPQSILSVNIYLATGQESNLITSHPGSRTTSWFANGNQVSAAALSGGSLASAAHWCVAYSEVLEMSLMRKSGTSLVPCKSLYPNRLGLLSLLEIVSPMVAEVTQTKTTGEMTEYGLGTLLILFQMARLGAQ